MSNRDLEILRTKCNQLNVIASKENLVNEFKMFLDYVNADNKEEEIENFRQYLNEIKEKGNLPN